MEHNKRPGRPITRTGEYQRKTIEIRADHIEFLNSLPRSWRASIEEALELLQERHNDSQSYRGETSDGKIVDVAGDEYAEALADGVKAEAEHRGFDPDNLTAQQREICENATYQEIDDPDTWAALVGDNQNVEFV